MVLKKKKKEVIPTYLLYPCKYACQRSRKHKQSPVCLKKCGGILKKNCGEARIVYNREILQMF